MESDASSESTTDAEDVQVITDIQLATKKRKIYEYFDEGKEFTQLAEVEEIEFVTEISKKRKNNSFLYGSLDKEAVADYALINGVENTLAYYKISGIALVQQTVSDWVNKKKNGIPLQGINLHLIFIFKFAIAFLVF